MTYKSILTKRYIYLRTKMNNSSQTAKKTAQVGRPTNRNQRRMYEYNQRKYNEAPLPELWADDKEPTPIAEKPRQSNRQRQRTSNWRQKQTASKNPPREITDTAEVTPGVVKASKEVINNEPIWQDSPFAGTHPVQRIYSQNADFSTFPLLCERVYADLEAENSRLRREMPFCAFQHVMTGVLNATIIDHVRSTNVEDRYCDEESPMNLIPDDIYVPPPINEYLRSIANTTTPQGDLVRMNFPSLAIPGVAAAAAGEAAAVPAGLFGVCNAATHNVYECYVSPYVTGELVTQTYHQNLAHAYAAWEPLPAGIAPVGANVVPNANLLGYRPNVERLTPEGTQCLADITFSNGQDMKSRLRWSSELCARISGTLKGLESRYKMVMGKPQKGSTTSFLGWMKVDTVEGHVNSTRLSTAMGPVVSSVALGSSQCYTVATFGLRRERKDAARGLCYTGVNHAALVGWPAHINDNFKMIGYFAPLTGMDLPSLRDERHTSASASGDMC